MESCTAGGGDYEVEATTSSRKRSSSAAALLKSAQASSKRAAPSFEDGIKNLIAMNKDREKLQEKLESGPVLVAANVSLSHFLKNLGKLESMGAHWEYEQGKVYIYELPHPAHDGAAGEISHLIDRAIAAQHRTNLRFAASPTCDNNDDRVFEPDASITNKSRTNRPTRREDAADKYLQRCPNIIVEVAFKESEPHVLNKAREWLELCDDVWGVQEVLVIKIGANVRANGHRTMKAWRFERGQQNAVQEIQFGQDGPNGGATGPDIPGMQLHVQTAHVFHPDPVPNGMGNFIHVDLHLVRRQIEDAF